MRISTQWLSEWVGVDLDGELLANELTTAGLEVEAVLPAAPSCAGVIVARIEEVEPHPQADRLSLCTVATGGEPVRVVCGAPNARPGLHVPFAPVGALVPALGTVAAVEVRGVASNGMLCSAKELGLSEEGSGLLVLDEAAVPGTPLSDHLRLGDTVLDIDLTPNRGDCFSVIGIAREVAARRGLVLRGPKLEAIGAASDERLEIALEHPSACPRFVGRVIKGLDLSAATPDWMKERLRRAGSRPIHPVVDVTNYVMLELGQPLHAYDLGKLKRRIVARAAAAGERLELLDGKQVELAADTLVIADAGGAVGLAGIMGGASTAVTTASRDVFLEAAFFSPDAILGRARQYGLHTDASLRFERGVDPTGQERAIERTTQLLMEIAGGEPGPLIVAEARDRLPRREPIALSHGHVEAVLGVELTRDAIESYLSRLGMTLVAAGDGWTVIAPPFRFDIAIEEDLIEEIGRMMGYDEIPIAPGPGAARLADATELRIEEERVADALVARGYSEVITYSFVDSESAALVNPGSDDVKLANPISADLGVMRRSLWPGLLLTAQQNLSRQQTRLRIFEIGHQFLENSGNIKEVNVLAGLAIGSQWPEHWDCEGREVDFYDVKADLEALLSMTGRAGELSFEAAEHPALMPGQSARVNIGPEHVGWLGRLHPRVQRHYELKSSPILFALNVDSSFASCVPAFQSYSKFPSVRRDLALLVDENVSVAQLLSSVREAAGETLQSVTVFDIYRGRGIESKRKSVGLGLILQGASRTLTDQDADQTVQSVRQRLEHELGATIRT